MECNKIWLIADTHFGMKTDDGDWLDEYIGYFKNEVIPYMRKNVKPNDILVHCGDVFDNRTAIGIDTITCVCKLFEEFSDIFNDIRIIIGNHDISKKNTNEFNSVNAIRNIKNVKVYETPKVETICGKKCLFNPWIENLEDEKKLLNSVDVDYIFGHLQIGGSRGSDRAGMTVSIPTGINKSDFKNAQVYAGHIHIRQDMKNVHYVGNPYHKDMGDIDNPKGYTILDIVSGETEFIENTYSPKFMKESIYEIMNLTMEELMERWKNNRVELHLNGTDSPKCSFDELRNILNPYYKSLNTKCDTTIVELDTTSSNIDFKSVKGGDEYLYEFIEKQEPRPSLKANVYKKLDEIKNKVR